MTRNQLITLFSAGLLAACSLALVVRKYVRDDNCLAVDQQKKGSRPTPAKRIVEVSLSDVESAVAAWEGGATSIELCADRANGGVTPSIGLVRECARRLGSLLQVHVLIRPRPGHFVYSHDEFDVMLQDIIQCKECGAAGVVVGVLTSDGRIDVPRVKVLREVSSPMQLTFHRAYDICTNEADEALHILSELRCDRLLTSGRKENAVLGEPHLQRLASSKSRGDIAVIAAAGVNCKNAKGIIKNTQVQGLHAGSAVHATYESDSSAATGVFTEFSVWQTVNSNAVHELVTAANKTWDAVETVQKGI